MALKLLGCEDAVELVERGLPSSYRHFVHGRAERALGDGAAGGVLVNLLEGGAVEEVRTGFHAVGLSQLLTDSLIALIQLTGHQLVGADAPRRIRGALRRPELYSVGEILGQKFR